MARRLPAAVDVPPADPSTASVPRWATAFLGEWRSAGLPLKLLTHAPHLLRGPRGDGPVVDVPGWLAPESTNLPLRGYLRYLGYDARGWGRGTNTGDPRRNAEALAVTVRELADETGREVALVGWSLGGVVAREVARQLPDVVRRVVTYGSPVVGGAAYTIAARSYRDQAGLVDRIERHERADPVRVPITALYTKRDAVVHWAACIDRISPDVEHVEVGSTHLGLGFDADVWRVVADRLAR